MSAETVSLFCGNFPTFVDVGGNGFIILRKLSSTFVDVGGNGFTILRELSYLCRCRRKRFHYSAGTFLPLQMSAEMVSLFSGNFPTFADVGGNGFIILRELSYLCRCQRKRFHYSAGTDQHGNCSRAHRGRTPPHWSSRTGPKKRRPMREQLSNLLICLRTTTLDQSTPARKKS
jgi:hypothetical protein